MHFATTESTMERKIMTRRKLTVIATVFLLTSFAAATQNYYQGFETNTGDWVASQAITRVPSGGGALGLPASSGSYYAELQNLHDGYGYPGFGDGGSSDYGGADNVYHGDFYQAIDIYIKADWAQPADTGDPSFWLDMTPYHADPNNYGAEHNFRFTATGSSVTVKVDGQATPFATITTSGWYTFVMTYRKAPNPSDPVITDMLIYNHSGALVGSTTVTATSPGGPFASSDLKGNGYVWITLWQNGFANDVLALDNQRTGLLPYPAVPFSQFQATIVTYKKQKAFNVAGSFKLGSSTNGINPATEPVSLTVGTYSVSIPANRFLRLGGSFAYLDLVNGLTIAIQAVGSNNYLFAVTKTGVLPGGPGPLPVSLTIGDDTGSTNAPQLVLP